MFDSRTNIGQGRFLGSNYINGRLDAYSNGNTI
jgi:hypothetical protein